MTTESARRLDVLEAEHKKITTQSRRVTDEMTEIEENLIKLLMQNNIMWIDTQINGVNKGPFFMIGKKVTRGAATAERELRFSKELGMKLTQGEVNSPQRMVEFRNAFFKQFQKKSLKLVKCDRLTDVYKKEELEQWLANDE